MVDLLKPQDIERLARDAGLSMAEVCRRAHVAPSTFQRWKNGETSPSVDVYGRLARAATKVTEAA